MHLDYWEIRIADRSGNQTAFFSSTVGTSPLLGCDFELNRNGGCGGFAMTIAKDVMQGTIERGNLVEFHAKGNGAADVLTRYYKGVIVSVPTKSTFRIVQYQAEGLWYQASRQRIVKYYEGKNTDDMVIDILADIDTTNSDISASTSEISIGSPYTVGDLEAEWITASDAIKLLAEVEQDVQYGVDQDGKLYFKDLDTTEVKTFQVGTHLDALRVIENTDQVVNRVYMQAKKLIGGGSLTLVRDDTTSSTKITTLGIRDALVTVPHLTDPDDVWRYGEYYLNEHGARETCDAKPTNFSEFIFPRGDARILDTDGTEYVLPIQSVNYRLDPTNGLIGEMSLGDELPPTVETEMREMLRDVAGIKSNAISLTKIEHTRGEEWQQESIIDGQDLGLLNHFTAGFTDLKTVDRDYVHATSGNVHNNFNNKEHYVTGTLPDNDWDWAQYWSKAIPSGQTVDSVRAHVLFDLYGRLNFEFDEDLSDYWTYVLSSGSGEAWKSDQLQPMLIYDNTLGDGELKYTGPAGFSWPASYKFRFRFQNWAPMTSAVHVWVYWDWVDATNWMGLRMRNDPSGPGYVRYNLYRRSTAGGLVNIGTPSELLGLRDSDQDVEITVRNTPSTTVMEAFRDGTLSEGTITSTSGVSSAGNDLKLGSWIGVSGTPPHVPACDVKFFEIQEFGTTAPRITHSISRNDGVSLTGLNLTQGTDHFTQDVSGQPAGQLLRIRSRVYWPARLYGWGLSFKN